MSNAKPMEIARTRRPGTHPCGRTRLHEIDRRHATEVMPLAVAREILLVRAPAHLTRLAALADESIDRPGVDELAGLLGDGSHLVVAFGDVHHLDTELSGKLAPLRPRLRVPRVHTGIGRNVEYRLLGEVRDEPRIRTMSDHGGRGASVPRTQRQRFLAERVVCPACGRDGWIRITTRPRLDARVEIHRASFPAKLD